MGGHSLGVDYRHALMACPACGYRVDASSMLMGVGPENYDPPADGHLSICLACAAINVYVNNATRLRPPTVDERGEFARDARIQVAVQTIIELRDKDGVWPKGPRR